MEYPEKLPIAQEGDQFPMRDIDDVHRIGMVDLWFNEIEYFNAPRMLNYALYQSRPASTSSQNVYRNHVAALQLCAEWDRNAKVENKYTVLGYAIARSMETATNLLPQWTTDMTNEITQMQREQANAIAFGRVAINSMYASYPTLYKQYERLYVRVTDCFDITDNEEKGYFQAGMVLPYMLTVADQLKRVAVNKNITGIVAGDTRQLDAMNFNDIFTSESE